MCDPVVFQNITPEQWLTMGARLTALRIEVSPADRSDVYVNTANLEWTYNPLAQTVTVQCTSKPWVMSCSEVNAKIQAGLS
jgi:hypothetical protein